MIGVLDSGVGGITAIREMRRILPSADILFFPDKENAPYGTKTQKELIPLVEKDIEILRSRGADLVLMACCTASTIHSFLKKEYRRITVPIIEPTSRAAAVTTKNGKVAVIATDATVRSGEFGIRLSSLGVRHVAEIGAKDLVEAIEEGARDTRPTEKAKSILDRYAKRIESLGIDTLILGCTHFPHLSQEIGKRLPHVNLISSSYEGAVEIAKRSRQQGNGKTIYIGRHS